MSKLKSAFTKRDMEMILSHPFYCINIHPSMCEEHPTMVSEKLWIEAAVQGIKERGPEKFLRDLLDNLKGKYVK